MQYGTTTINRDGPLTTYDVQWNCFDDASVDNVVGDAVEHYTERCSYSFVQQF